MPALCRPHRRFSASLLVGALALVSGRANATDTVTQPFNGVTWLHRSVSGSLNLHALTIDLCAKGVSVRATMPTERGKTVSAFGTLVGAAAAVNGDFFTFSTYKPTGLAIGNGTTWSDTANDGFESSIAFGKNRAEVLPTAAAKTPGTWVTDLLSSRPQILQAGQIKRGFTMGICAGPITADGDCAKDPRTGIGLSEDKRTLYLVVVDGRQPALSAGQSTYDLATTMQTLGAWDAVNMDSGGSSQMWIQGKGIVNSPSDGSERVVANHLAVMAGGTSDPENCTPLADADGGQQGSVPSSDAGTVLPPLVGDGGAGAAPSAGSTADSSGCGCFVGAGAAANDDLHGGAGAKRELAGRWLGWGAAAVALHRARKRRRRNRETAVERGDI